MVDWSLLPKDLLERINSRLETCLEIVHFRSVCSTWRSAITPPSYIHGLGINSLLPIFKDNNQAWLEGDKHCILKKIPVFLFTFQTPFGTDYAVIGIYENKYGKQKLLSPLADFRMTSIYGIVLNSLSPQITLLGHYYKVATLTKIYTSEDERLCKKVAVLPLDSEDGRNFAVMVGVLRDLLMYKSSDNKWTRIIGPFKSFGDIVSFKRNFYVVDMSGWGHVFVIEPSMEVSEINPVSQSHESSEERLVVSGDDLLLVQRFTPGEYDDEYMHTWFRLFRLEEVGQRRWVSINDLEDRVVFLGTDWNVCYSAKKIPSVKGNCVFFST